LENSAPVAVDSIASQMAGQAHRAIEESEHLILIQDATDTRPPVKFSRKASLTILTKADLLKSPAEAFAVSAHTESGIADLYEHLDELAFAQDTPGDSLSLTARHLRALEETLGALARAGDVADDEELLAAELRAGLDFLGEIIGVVTPDDILGTIFSTFCIGK
jgi:tRNA U34 5-carboxymethylaminomethyl modifying GTPase MnmE/TrmE